jgi:hypothetical protein
MSAEFPIPSRTPFGHPLTEWDVRQFTHPDPSDSLHRVHINAAGQILAANGTVALRVENGRWLPADFTPAPPAVLDRLAKLPWEKFPVDAPPEQWRAMDEAIPALFRFQFDPVFERKAGTPPRWKFFPSVPVRVADGPDVALGILQLISRLPRAELHVEGLRRESPVFFRFTGGAGVIAYRRTGDMFRFSIFKPQRDHNHRIIERRSAPKPRFPHSGPQWPPKDESDIPTTTSFFD